MRQALFLDRDGVINVEKEYLYKQEDFEFIEGIFDLCRYYQDLGYLIFVVTNQSGIARKFYSEADFSKLTQWMLGAFEKEGIHITKVYHCPHHPDISGECACRKPKPGMLLDAAKEYGVDLANSVMVGDKERDIEAALNAGLRESYLFDEFEKIKTTKATKKVKKLDEIWK
ncbi:D-glycero-D-manno-heptose 1,7-bisphosphate phosphatase [hydrothermal vent metagenome]|uniref:D,D-heptose 1,7-bisphosphate phosphatase n=1 Tax=hydrothermal vent metagenome TaxID=652676 RepID=A0A1W1BZZ7_9ZZZZ